MNDKEELRFLTLVNIGYLIGCLLGCLVFHLWLA